MIYRCFYPSICFSESLSIISICLFIYLSIFYFKCKMILNDKKKVNSFRFLFFHHFVWLNSKELKRDISLKREEKKFE